jgi:hypothetical protein
MKKSLLVTTLSLALLAGNAIAQNKEFSSESLGVKTRLETLLTERVSSLIATSLDRDAFKVNVQVELLRIVTKSGGLTPTDDNEAIEEIPKSMSLWMLDTENVLTEHRIERNMASIDQPEIEKVSYQVENVSVTVGLLKEFAPSYVEEFKGWMQKQVQAQFGEKGLVTVSTIEPKPYIAEPAAPPPTFFERLTEYQNALGFGFVGLAMIMAALFVVGFLKKGLGAIAKAQSEGSGQRSVASSAAAQPQIPAASASSMQALPEGSGADSGAEVEWISGMRGKVERLLSELGPKINEVFVVWVESGSRGLTKLACLMDILITNGDSSVSPLHQFQIPDELSDEMTDIFRKMPTLSFRAKRQLLEVVYWDLFTMKSLGKNALQKPFEYMDELSPGKLKDVLTEQDANARALAIMHMSDQARQKYLQKLPADAKREIILNSASVISADASQVQVANEQLKTQIDQMQSAKSGKTTELLVRLFGSFSVYEETMLLRQVSHDLAEHMDEICRKHPNLAFVDRWPTDKLEILVRSAMADEIIALYRTIPELSRKILEVFPPRVREIVESDLEGPDTMSIVTKDQHLSTLKDRLLAYVQSGQIDLEDLIIPQQQGEQIRAA